MAQVSIIVPVYQVEKYLRQCIDSILAQTFTDLELILVDDGSKDQSGQICEEYSERDSRICVIHTENRGAAAARNAGLARASGPYIAFVDSDDYLSENMLQRMCDVSQNSKCDLVICNFLHVFPPNSLIVFGRVFVQPVQLYHTIDILNFYALFVHFAFIYCISCLIFLFFFCFLRILHKFYIYFTAF